MSIDALLTPHQLTVARRVLAEEAQKRDHVVVYLSGAHAYGFPSPDSDLDLKAIHVAPTATIVGLTPVAPTCDRAEVLEGVEIDYASNELGHALSGILAGNGNFLERVLGTTVAVGSPWLDALRPIATRALSRRVHRHYRGFATSQRMELEKKPTVKKMLYVLRTTLTGTHLLRTGALLPDLTALIDDYGFSDARALVEAKRAGEQVALEGVALARWRLEIDRAFALLDAAEGASSLPLEPANVAEVEAWLLAVRRARF